MRLRAVIDSSIFSRHLQNQMPGLEPWIMILATHDAPRLFLCRAFSYTSMAGWTGAP